MPKESASAPIFLDQKPTVRIHPEISDEEMTAQRERDLVLRSVNGCAESFGTWFEYHREGLYKKAYFMTGSAHVAEDIVSDVFERTFKAMPRFRLTDAPPKAFLFRVAHNQSINHLRAKKENSQLHDGIVDNDRSGFDADVVRSLDMEAQAEALRNVVAGLKKDQSDVIRMRFLEGLEYNEVAEAMGRTVAAIRVIQCRALAELREQAKPLEKSLRTLNVYEEEDEVA